MKLRTRLAPSPTGEMHTGHLLHLIHVFGIARKASADIVYRMEDHDRLRCRPEFAEQWKSDLRWLGFTTGDEAWSVQSEHAERYIQLLERLREVGLVYACSCSRKMIEERRAATRISGSAADTGSGSSGSGYDGFCRNRGLPFSDQNGVRLQLNAESQGFVDLRLGEQTCVTDQADPLLRDNRGLFTYQFCVVADDIVEDVNLIIRGEDLLESTAQQLQMRRLFAPLLGKAYSDVAFYHHPLLYDERGRKLSKTHQSLHLSAMRAAGEKRPEQLLGHAARLAGLTTSEVLHADECVKLFQNVNL
ncbi:MAG: hypothetical protein CVV45_01275 [Spirochaetae bacterium HGW-Spirochaetae-10]|nr:MAG: hypothetical protein CVV45_01275 [Spirochaetae bacterium HGW-Spirochaetae-10]